MKLKEAISVVILNVWWITRHFLVNFLWFQSIHMLWIEEIDYQEVSVNSLQKLEFYPYIDK